MEKKYDGLKVYGVYVKYVNVRLGDGDELIYEAYSPLPRGHDIEKELIKLSLKDAVNKIKNAKGNDDLIMDYSGVTAYSPSDIKKVFWSKDEDVARGVYLIDVTGSKDTFKEGVTINIGEDQYVCHKVIDWTANFKVKFVYATKAAKPKVVKPKVKPEAKKPVKKATKKEVKK